MSRNKVTRRLCVQVALLVLVPTLAAAQFGVPLGKIYLSAEENAQVPFMQNVPAFGSFDFFLVLDVDYVDLGQEELNLANGVGSWEARVNIPEEVTITARELRPASSINVATGEDNYVVGMGQLVTGASTPYAVVRYSGVLFDVGLQDLVLTVEASSPSSFDDDGGPGLVPGWLEFRPHTECESRRNGCLRSFSNWSDRFVINCENETECDTQAADRASWGAIKGRFGQR